MKDIIENIFGFLYTLSMGDYIFLIATFVIILAFVYVLYLIKRDEDMGSLYSNDDISYLENTNNVVLVFNNQEIYIRNIIKSIIKNVDMIIIDNISEIVTINESKDYSIKKRQNLENILQELYKLAYSNNKCIILVNSYIYKDDMLTPKYNNVMQSLCENRIEIKDNYELELKK